mmetsp:Transcript_12979/g.45637  ORF Transcript_12979/g.45637 Transcript_12979/m.45637 type:complete len:180 (+) Transcript_12979:291-830(+)
MMQFRGSPWKVPKAVDSLGKMQPKEGPKDYLEVFKRTRGSKVDKALVPKTEGLVGTNFIQCEQNPGVALDQSNHKYRLLQFEAGVAKPKGCFHTEEEGITGYSALIDQAARGPHGVAGVPRSLGNQGPPGVALLPKLHWQQNKGRKLHPRKSLLVNQGLWDGSAPDHNKADYRPDIMRA